MARRGSRLLRTMLLAAALALTACASSAARVTAPTSTLSVTPSPTADANRYTDAKLGFSLDVPSGWRAEAQPGSLAPVSTAPVTLAGDQSAHPLLTLAAPTAP